MQSLVFLTNNLQHPSKQKQALLKMTPLQPGFVYGKMYLNNRKPFVVLENGKKQGNRVVYGTLYLVEDYEHYRMALDALNDCSLSLIGRNHSLDLNHRIIIDVTTIKFESIALFLKARIYEKTTIQAWAYIGNTNHPKIIKKLSSKKNSYRVQRGFANGFIKQWEIKSNDI